MANEIVFSLIFLFFANIALALQCYQCLSIANNDCTLKPKQKKFEYDCHDGNVDSSHNTKQYTSSLNMRCGMIVMSYSSLTVTKRLCLRDVDTCERLNKLVSSKNFTLHSCNICNSDLCNSVP